MRPSLVLTVILVMLAGLASAQDPLFVLQGGPWSAFAEVGGAGDLDGDGHADLLVAGYWEGSGNGTRVYSGANGLLLFPQTLEGGTSVDGGRDIDGDGVPDFVSGRDAYHSDGLTYNGRIWARSGPDGALLWTRSGGAVGDKLGTSVRIAGDVDSDGWLDVIAGAPQSGFYIWDGYHPGYARVFSGQTGEWIHTFVGIVNGGEFGHSVDGAGDVNGDGRADLIVGATGYFQVFSGIDGTVIRTHGGAGGQARKRVAGVGDIDGDGHDDYAYGDDVFNVVRVYSGVDGTLIHEWEGAENYGRSLDGVGDVDGDGVPDIVATAPLSNGPFGGGYGHAVIRSGSDGSILNVFHGPTQGASLGLASCAGDVDGDGVNDIIVSPHGLNAVSVFPGGGHWINDGLGMGGISPNAVTPFLAGSGTLKPHSFAALRVGDAGWGTPAFLVVGVQRLDQPFHGGTLVPTPDVVVAVGETSEDLFLQGAWPVGVPSGTEVYMQVWTLDQYGPQGFKATNGLTAIAP